MAMNTEDSLREYLRLFVRIPLVGRIGPLARTFDFVADAAPGVKEILAVGKLVLRGARAPLRPRRRRRRGERPHRRPARRAAARSASSSRSASSATRREWMIDILDDPARTGARHRHDAGGDAGHRDDRAARPGRARETERRRRGVIVNRVLPALFGRARGEVFADAARDDAHAAARCRRRRPAGGRPCSTPPSSTEARRRHGAGHLDRLRDGARADAADAVRPRAVHPATGPRASSRQVAEALDRRSSADGRRGRPRGPMSDLDRAARGQGDDHRLRQRAASARRRSPRRSARRPRRTSAARCSCSPSTRPGGWPPRSASSRSATPRPACPTRRSPTAGVEPRGELWAAMLDTKAGVGRADPPPRARRETRDAVLANPLYQNITGRFVQSHDYIAMERLYEIHASRPLRPGHRRHAAVAQRPRLPRRAERGWPTSSAAGCCAG